MSAASRAALDRDMRDERMKECAGEMFKVLKALVDGLDETSWSSWQATYHFMPHLDAARDLVFKVEQPF